VHHGGLHQARPRVEDRGGTDFQARFRGHGVAAKVGAAVPLRPWPGVQLRFIDR
jgi:hypothetical protein